MSIRQFQIFAPLVPLFLCCLSCESQQQDALKPWVVTAAPQTELLDERPQPWQRREQPIMSIDRTKQMWSKTMLYSPSVIWVDGVFKMWYVGSGGDYHHEKGVLNIGFAQSEDGIHWSEYAENPILTGEDIPFAPDLQTPFVLFDEEEGIYKMWFIGLSFDAEQMDQILGYATSSNGTNWKVRPEPVYWSGRSPSVIKEGPNQYRMWMNSRPSPDSDHMDLYSYIYEFRSPDGIRWERGSEPLIRPSGKAHQGVIYPYVLKEEHIFRIWYGAFDETGEEFHLFSASSEDGSSWSLNHNQAAFGASPHSKRFDAKFVSTPCVLNLKDRYLLYYSARDERAVGGGNIYQHIGLAVIPKRP